MSHRASPSFWQCYRGLPQNLQTLADKQYKLLRQNPAHPSLYFKKVGKAWSVRINDDYRAMAFKEGDDFVWFWIGSHDSYERLIKRL